MRHATILWAAGVFFAALASSVSAAVSWLGHTTINQNFNSLGTSSVANAFSATVGAQTFVPGAPGFDGTRLGGTGMSALSLNADAGSNNQGGLYSYGATGNSDRALGALASSANFMGFGFSVRNDHLVNSITSITVAFTQENWRSSTVTQNVIAAAWGTSATAGADASNYLTSGALTAVAALDLVGPDPIALPGSLNGNDPLNQVSRTFTFTGLNIAPTEYFFLRWQDVNDDGNDAGLAIDNMVLTFTSVPEASSLAFAGATSAVSALAYCFRRRRQGRSAA
jgi:hypothetical protein